MKLHLRMQHTCGIRAHILGTVLRGSSTCDFPVVVFGFEMCDKKGDIIDGWVAIWLARVTRSLRFARLCCECSFGLKCDRDLRKYRRCYCRFSVMWIRVMSWKVGALYLIEFFVPFWFLLLYTSDLYPGLCGVLSLSLKVWNRVCRCLVVLFVCSESYHIISYFRVFTMFCRK